MADRRRIVTFDCYPTLIDFDLEGATDRLAGDRIAEAIAILSNSDEDLIVHAVRRLAVPFD